MNSNIDLKSLGSSNATGVDARSDRLLVGPPRRIGTRVLLPAGLIMAFVGVFGYATRGSLLPAVDVQVEQPVVLTNGSAASADAETVAPVFQAPGWIEPYPFETQISASAPGIVRRIHVLEGQQVSSGTLVAELADEEARVNLDQANAELELRKAELAAAEATRDHPSALTAAVRTAEADLARAKAEHKRMEQTGAISSRQAQAYKNLVDRGASPAITASKADSEAKAAELSVEEAHASVDAAEAMLASARERLKLLVDETNRVLIAKAAVAKAEVAVRDAAYRLALRRVVAATSGTIMNLHVGEGASISPDFGRGLLIASMYDPSRLQARVEVPLADAGKIRLGMAAEITVEAMPDHVIHGELVRVVHMADIQRNSLPVKVRVLDPDPALKPEMVARVQFLDVRKGDTSTSGSSATTGSGAISLLIPSRLAGRDAKEASLWIVSANGRAQRRPVTLGPMRSGDMREVGSGLLPSDKLIVSDTKSLKEGCRVRTQSR